MVGFESAINILLQWGIPLFMGIVLFLYRGNRREIDKVSGEVISIRDKVSLLDTEKISYLQTMALLDKQEERIVSRLNSMDKKLDRVIERIVFSMEK